MQYRKTVYTVHVRVCDVSCIMRALMHSHVMVKILLPMNVDITFCVKHNDLKSFGKH